MTASDLFEAGQTWTDERARMALPILLLAKTGQIATYDELDKKIAYRYGIAPMPMVIKYNGVLEKVGSTLAHLSDEWIGDVPPINVLVVNQDTRLPGEGVDGFLSRYVQDDGTDQLTNAKRKAIVERATNAVHNYDQWDDVAEYFKIDLTEMPAETRPLSLPPPSPMGGGEGQTHQDLKRYVADHPELFARFGKFDNGEMEFLLRSADKVDVLFRNEEQILAVEVKTEDAPAGDLTRGVFQCVKYRAVLRAMCDTDGQLVEVKTALATPQELPDDLQVAANRLHIPIVHVSHVVQ